MKDRFTFRGKDILTNKWVYGAYLKFLPYTPSPLDPKPNESEYKNVIIHEGFSDWSMPINLKVVEVKKETVGQCTGLKDSTGALIFEGDILEVKYDGGQIPLFNREYTNDPEPETYFVQYSEDWQTYFCRNTDLNHWLNPPLDYLNKTFERQLNPDDADVNNRVTLGKAILVNDYNKFNKIIGNIHDNPELLKGEINESY